MPNLGTATHEELATELLRRFEAAETHDQQDALRGTMSIIAQIVTTAHSYTGMFPNYGPLNHVTLGLLLKALNRHLIDDVLRYDRKAFSTLFKDASVTQLIEAMAAERWFENAESLGAALGRPPHGIYGLCSGPKVATPAHLMAIARTRLEMLVAQLTETAITTTNRTAAEELMWWYGITHGLVSVADHDLAVALHDQTEAVDVQIARLQRTMTDARSIIRSWGYKFNLKPWGRIDRNAAPLETLFIELDSRLQKAREMSEQLGQAQ